MEKVHTETTLRHEKGDRALYIQIKDIYKEKILKGELQSGDRIESESEIQKIFGVSRITARQAILDLEKDGMVMRGRGKGTFVTWNAAGHRNMDSLNHHIKFNGTSEGVCSYEAEVRAIRPELCSTFNLPASEIMYCFRRLQKTPTQILYYAESYYPMDLHLPDLSSRPDEELLNMAEEKTRMQTAKVVEEIGVEIPSSRIRRILNIQSNIPILTRKRVLMNKEEQELEWTIAYYRGDMCSVLQHY